MRLKVNNILSNPIRDINVDINQETKMATMKLFGTGMEIELNVDELFTLAMELRDAYTRLHR